MSEPPSRGLSFSTWPTGAIGRVTLIVEAFLEGSTAVTQDDIVRLRNIVRRTELPDAPDADVESLLQHVLDDVHIPPPNGGPIKLLAADDPPPVPADAVATAAATTSGTASQSVMMPTLGASTTEGTVTCWLKAVGEAVDVDEPLLQMSTDKVDIEIPSPIAGVIERILVQEDETVKVGTKLAVIARNRASDVPAARRLLSQQTLDEAATNSWSKWRSLGRRVEVTQIAGSRGGRHTHTLFGLTAGSGSPIAWSTTTDSVTAQWQTTTFPAPSEECGTLARRANAGSGEQQRFVGLTSFSSGPGHQEVILASAEGDLFASQRLGGAPWSRWQRISWVGRRIRQISGSCAWPGYATVFALTADSRLLYSFYKVGEDPLAWNEMDTPAPGRYVSLTSFSRGVGLQDLLIVAANGSLFSRNSHSRDPFSPSSHPREWSPWQKFGEIPNTRQVIGVGMVPLGQQVFALTSDSRLLCNQEGSTGDANRWEEIELPSRDLYVGIAAYSLTPGSLFLFAATESGSVHFKKLTTGQHKREAAAEQAPERNRKA